MFWQNAWTVIGNYCCMVNVEVAPDNGSDLELFSTYDVFSEMSEIYRRLGQSIGDNIPVEVNTPQNVVPSRREEWYDVNMGILEGESVLLDGYKPNHGRGIGTVLASEYWMIERTVKKGELIFIRSQLLLPTSLGQL